MAKRRKDNKELPVGNAIEGFSFGMIDPMHQHRVVELTQLTRQALMKSLAALIEAGRYLREARPLIPHGYWGSYVEQAVEMSATWATNCMNLHSRFVEQRPDILELELPISVTAMIHLAKAPDAAIDEVIERSARGEVLIVKRVDEIIDRHAGKSKKNGTIAATPVEPATGEDALKEMNRAAVDGWLIPETIYRLQRVLSVLEDAEDVMHSGQKPKKVKVEAVREDARWLRDALEQITQRRADSAVPPVHRTFVERGPHDPGPWADTATFLSDVSTSEAWAQIPASDVPHFVAHGLKALRGALFS